MAGFVANAQRFDPYRNFHFRLKWGGKYVAGASKVSGLKRNTDVVEHRDGGNVATKHKSRRNAKFEPLTLERGITHDPEFDAWAFSARRDSDPAAHGPISGISAKTCCWSFTTRGGKLHRSTRSAVPGFRNSSPCPIWMRAPMPSRSSRWCSSTRVLSAKSAHRGLPDIGGSCGFQNRRQNDPWRAKMIAGFDPTGYAVAGR